MAVGVALDVTVAVAVGVGVGGSDLSELAPPLFPGTGAGARLFPGTCCWGWLSELSSDDACWVGVGVKVGVEGTGVTVGVGVGVMVGVGVCVMSTELHHHGSM